jgi:dihydropteroate synthase
MVSAGADLIDVGGESGRTDRAAITPEEEAGRVLPVIEGLRELGIAVSVDTWRVAVAEAAIVAGATVINDVSGLADPDMARLAARTGTGLVIMHTRAAPKRESFPGYEDVVQDVITFLGEKASAARELGVASDQIILDPGPDFAKTPEESVEIIRRFDELSTLRRPLLLAASRKYFVGMITGRLPHQRLGGTLAAVARGVDAGAHLVRVHDVAEVVAYLDVRTALASCEAPDFKGARADDTLKWLPEPTGGHP